MTYSDDQINIDKYRENAITEHHINILIYIGHIVHLNLSYLLFRQIRR